MASSSSSLSLVSRIFSRHFVLRSHCNRLPSSTRFCSTVDGVSTPSLLSDLDIESDSPESTKAEPAQPQEKLNFQRPLENGLDQGVFKVRIDFDVSNFVE